MVVTIQRGAGLLASGVLIASALTGCASRTGVNPPASQDGGSTNSSDPSSSTSAPVSLQNPLARCDGIRSESDASSLISAGESVALVKVQVSDDAGPVQVHARNVSVVSATLLAGGLPNGTVTTVEEAAVDESTNVLPPGDYLILVGVTPTASTYFLSDAYRGSFVVDGDHAYQRCPDPSKPGQVKPVMDGTTDIAGLTEVFKQAFK